MVVDMNLHNPDHENPNPHCHLMLTMRPFEKDGSFVKKKCWREYDLEGRTARAAWASSPVRLNAATAGAGTAQKYGTPTINTDG